MILESAAVVRGRQPFTLEVDVKPLASVGTFEYLEPLLLGVFVIGVEHFRSISLVFPPAKNGNCWCTRAPGCGFRRLCSQGPWGMWGATEALGPAPGRALFSPAPYRKEGGPRQFQREEKLDFLLFRPDSPGLFSGSRCQGRLSIQARPSGRLFGGGVGRDYGYGNFS